MNSSPIVTWEGAEATYTWADAPSLLGFCLALMALIVVGVVVQSLRHEKKSFERAEGVK